MIKATFVFTLSICLFLAVNATGDSTHGDHQHHPTVHQGGAAEHGHGGGHHGIRLASWRWSSYRTIIMFTFLVILAAVLKLAFHHTHLLAEYLPESCVLIIVGIVIGLIVYSAGEYDHEHHTENRLVYFPSFTADLFFNVLLPPIILDAAYALYDRDFLSNIGSIILYAVVGTLFNVFTVGYGLYFLAKVGAMGSFECAGAAVNVTQPCDIHATSFLTFSSLISAVDPVAVLAIFEEIGVNMGLYFLVFGESLLNDGVTVVLYNTMIALAGQPNVPDLQYVLAVLSFFTVVFGGLAVGILVGMVSALILKSTKDVRVIEPLIILASAFLAYMLAECLHWSGIISLIGCGIVQKRYAFPNMSAKSYTTVKYGVKTLASLSDCIIFLFLGVVTVTHKKEWHTGFVLWTLILCFVVRFIGVYALTYLINKRRVNRIGVKEQFIMAYGGLRGAVGFSLVVLIPENLPSQQKEWNDIFLLTTLIMIFFTVFIQGGTIKFLVSKLNIGLKSEEGLSMAKDTNLITMDHVMAGVESVTGYHSQNVIMSKIQSWDERFVKRYLIRGGTEDLLALRMKKITVEDHVSRLYGPTVVARNQVENYENNHTNNAHGPFPEGSNNKKFVSGASLAAAMAMTPFSLYRNSSVATGGGGAGSRSPDTIRRQLADDYETRMGRLQKDLEVQGSFKGGRVSSVTVKRQYDEDMRQIKGNLKRTTTN